MTRTTSSNAARLIWSQPALVTIQLDVNDGNAVMAKIEKAFTPCALAIPCGPARLGAQRPGTDVKKAPAYAGQHDRGPKAAGCAFRERARDRAYVERNATEQCEVASRTDHLYSIGTEGHWQEPAFYRAY